jgi:hypothetical protein
MLESSSFFPIETRYLPSAPAQPGIAADRFAREIVRFLTLFLGRARGS